MMTLRGCVLRMTTPSSMVASRFKYNTWQLRSGEFSLAQWLWYWLINRAALVRVPPGSYISAMHLFISFFVRKKRLVLQTRKNHGLFGKRLIRGNICRKRERCAKIMRSRTFHFFGKSFPFSANISPYYPQADEINSIFDFKGNEATFLECLTLNTFRKRLTA